MLPLSTGYGETSTIRNGLPRCTCLLSSQLSALQLYTLTAGKNVKVIQQYTVVKPLTHTMLFPILQALKPVGYPQAARFTDVVLLLQNTQEGPGIVSLNR